MKKLALFFVIGRLLVEAAELLTHAHRAAGEAWGYPWRRPPWGGGNGGFWQGR